MKYLNNNKILGRRSLCLAINALLITTALSATMAMSSEPINSETISYSFTFVEPNLQTVEADNSHYTNINMRGCMALGMGAGKPNMPVKFIKLLLPPMKKVAGISVVGEPNELNLGGYNLKQKPVFPYQNPVPIGNSEPRDFKVDSETYNSKNPYPSDIYGEYHIGYSHGYAILDMALFPVQYIPDEGRLFIRPEMTVNIDLEETQKVNQFFRNSRDDKEWVEKLVYNPEITDMYTSDMPTFGYDGGLCDPSDDYDYVIITTTQNDLDYWDTSEETPYNWESLMEKHKTDNGLNCTLVTVEDIDDCEDYYNDTPLFDDIEAHIREFCKDAYQDWGTNYIFIGGDDDTIPAREMDYQYESNVDADIYWNHLDKSFNADEDYSWGEEGDTGFDVYAELFLGRIPCDEPQDVSNWMTKSFYYADTDDMAYLDNAAFYGGYTTWPCQGDDFIDYSAIKGTDDWLGPNPGDHGPYPSWLGFQYGFETWNKVNPGVIYNLSVKWTAEPPNPGWQGGSTSAAIAGLKNAINNDQVTIISGIAHANSYMSLDVYDYEWESNYHNTKPFFIHDYGCHCGDIDTDDGVLHSMLFHSDTELAFGCVYNTGYGWGSFQDTNSSSALQQKSFWDYMFDTKNNSETPSNWQLGKAHAWSKDTMAPTLNWTYTSAPGSWRGTIEACLLFGDPAQRLKAPNAAPEKPDQPIGPTEGVTNIEYTFQCSAIEPEGEDIYYMFDWGDSTYSDWIGPYESGETGEGKHKWSEPGYFDVKAKAKDIKGGESKWSEPLTIHILQAPVMDIGLISGGLFKVNAVIKNIGEVDADDASWSITLDGGAWIGKETTGENLTITAGGEETISSGPILGFGKTTVTVTVEVPESSDTRSQGGKILLFFLYVNPGG